jgi:hypothetical protein
MSPPSLTEVSMALQGAIRLAQLDAGGMALFNRSLTGFWRSFFAAVLAAPLQVYVLLIARPVPPGAAPLRLISIEVIAYVIGWLIYPVVMLMVVDLIARRARYVDYIVAYNWASIPQYMLFVPVVTIAVASPAIGALLYLVVRGAMLVYQWFIARAALQVSNPLAIALALFEFVLGVALDRITLTLLRA